MGFGMIQNMAKAGQSPDRRLLIFRIASLFVDKILCSTRIIDSRSVEFISYSDKNFEAFSDCKDANLK